MEVYSIYGDGIMVSREVNDLMMKAQRYLELAKIALEKGFYSEVCFLSSLAAELYIKGVSLAITGGFPTVHDLREILNYIRINKKGENMIDEFIRENRERLRLISNEYLVSRYNLGSTYDKEDAENCLKILLEVIDFGSKLLQSVS
ncbi:MAG: HEPN domain-containing protein [Sulfolobaceae archaeon]